MGSLRTAAFHTLGCKLNLAETGTLARELENEGYARVAWEDRPDVFVLNTCSVTENANRECRQWVRRAQRTNPHAVIAVVGCYAQLKPQEIAQIPGVDLVLGANEKFDLAAHLQRIQAKPEKAQALFGPVKHAKQFVPSWTTAERTRTFLKVQDGCDHFCSFCTIPLARGRSRSATVAATVATAHRLAQSGVKEIVLTGVNTGDFGRANGESLLELVRALDLVEGIARFRLSSVEPELLTPALIDAVVGSRAFMPHFHLPLQSGSDLVLQRMRRRYTTSLYAERLAYIKAALPHACIGADVITGTPGETDDAFAESMAFVVSQPLDYLHVFTYSERLNTTAVRMADSVPMETRRKRTHQLRVAGSRMQHTHYTRNLGTVRQVLVEQEAHDGQLLGYTDNYVRVALAHDVALVHHTVPVHLQHLEANGHVFGTSVHANTTAH
jgi:threonylcarbamoyladenosine tRNA methylthiotransferase MtaB